MFKIKHLTKKNLYTTIYFKSLLLLLFTIISSLTWVGGKEKAYAGYNLGDTTELSPRIEGNTIKFTLMRKSPSYAYSNYVYHSTSGGKLIVRRVTDKTLWRSIHTNFVYNYSIVYNINDSDSVSIHSSHYDFINVPDSLIVYRGFDIVGVTPIQFEFIGYEYTPTNLSYKPTNKTSLKFNEMNLTQFRTSLNTIPVGTTIPIKIHKKHVGNLIVRKTSNHVLYLEDDIGSNVRLFEVNIESSPDFTDQKISSRPLIDINEYITRLVGQDNLRKRLLSN